MKTKKITTILLGVAMIFCVMFAFTACGSKIAAPDTSTFAYDGTYITWEQVDGADYYNVSINGGTATRSNSTTFQYTDGGTFEVTITAVGEKAKASSSFTFKPIGEISEIYVSDSGELSWDAVSGANAYSISINGTASTTTENYYDKLSAGSNRVKVKPIVSGDNSYYSFWSSEKNVYIYSAPTSVSYDSDTALLTWSGNSTKYEVTINGTVYSVTSNSLSYASNYDDFEVSIKAVGDHSSTYDSKQTVEEFHYLETITEISVEDGIVSWDEIDGATAYKVKLSYGTSTNTYTVTETSYQNLVAGRSYDIQIMPVNTTGNYFSSWSATSTLYILETPTTYWNNGYDLSDGVARNNFYWDAVTSANGYVVEITSPNGVTTTETISSATTYFTNSYNETGTYTVRVKATASLADSNYYDSKYSSSWTITRLSAPTLVSDAIVSTNSSLAEGFTVNYNEVNGASGYILLQEDTSVATATNASIKYTNIPSSTSEQQITYKLATSGSYSNSSRTVYLGNLTENSTTFTITVLATPSDLTMEGTTFGWGTVATATNGYVVQYGGTTVSATSNSLDLSILNAGSYSVSVCTKGNGSEILASGYSTAITVQRLAYPTDISITSDANGTLKYSDVTYATGYSVYLDESTTALDQNSWNDMYSKISTSGTTLSMVADANYWINNTYYMSSTRSESQQFIRLMTPTYSNQAVVATENYMIWNMPSNVSTTSYSPTYGIYTNTSGSIYSTSTSTSYDISSLPAGSYTFYIKAVGNSTTYLDSDYSQAITFTKLATPTITVDVSNGLYTWNGVDNAYSYELSIDGTVVSTQTAFAGSSYSYQPEYTTTGSHIVSLKAIGNGMEYINSSVCTYTQTVAQLIAPEISSVSYSENTVNLSSGYIIVVLSNAVANATGYRYEIAGTTSSSTELSSTTFNSSVIDATGTYKIKVTALGGAFDSNGVMYINSTSSAEMAITLLAAPNSSTVTINSYNQISWTAVNSAVSYNYEITIGDKTSSGTVTASSLSLSSLGYSTLDAGTQITIRLQAVGSGTTIISSSWVTATLTK